MLLLLLQLLLDDVVMSMSGRAALRRELRLGKGGSRRAPARAAHLKIGQYYSPPTLVVFILVDNTTVILPKWTK